MTKSYTLNKLKNRDTGDVLPFIVYNEYNRDLTLNEIKRIVDIWESLIGGEVRIMLEVDKTKEDEFYKMYEQKKNEEPIIYIKLWSGNRGMSEKAIDMFLKLQLERKHLSILLEAETFRWQWITKTAWWLDEADYVISRRYEGLPIIGSLSEIISSDIRAMPLTINDVEKRKNETDIKALLQATLYLRDSHVRGAAVEALGEIGDYNIASNLIRSLKMEAGFVREKAVEALKKIKAILVFQPQCLECNFIMGEIEFDPTLKMELVGGCISCAQCGEEYNVRFWRGDKNSSFRGFLHLVRQTTKKSHSYALYNLEQTFTPVNYKKEMTKDEKHMFFSFIPVKSVCPHCNKKYQDDLSGTDCPDCGGTIL